MITIKKNDILRFAAGAAMCTFLLTNTTEPNGLKNVFCVDVNAAAKIAAENISAPEGDFSLGKSFGFGGVIKTNSEELHITKVYGGIYKSDGKSKVIYCEDTADSSEYDLKTKFDESIAFNELPKGKYTYIIRVKDSSGNRTEVVKTSFSVVDNSKLPSAAETAEMSLPPNKYPKGSEFAVRGIISSTHNITKIKGGVYKADGKTKVLYFEDSPNINQYDMQTVFDEKLSFAALETGEYVYKIIIKDARGEEITIANKKFSVVETASAPSVIETYSATYPTDVIPQGRGFWVKGTVWSAHELKKVWAGVYNKDGSPTACVVNLEADGNVFDLKQADDLLLFNELGEGEYIYIVTAEDKNGYRKNLINSSFKLDTAQDTNTPYVMTGIDVSSHQSEIDWKKVKESGIDFVILRAGKTSISDADYSDDSYFEKNYDGAKAAGLKVGAYIYTSAFNKTEMENNISDLLKTLGGKEFELPVYIDIETDQRQKAPGKKAMTEIVKYGCSLIEKGGYKAGVYANRIYFTDFLDAAELKNEGYEIWYALYPEDPSEYNFSEFGNIWQYCSDGIVGGIAGNEVDMNYSYIDFE